MQTHIHTHSYSHVHTHTQTHTHTHIHTHSHTQFCVKREGSMSTNVMVSNSIRRNKKVAEEGGILRLPREGELLFICNQTKMENVSSWEGSVMGDVRM
jgi:hypothetical protein